MKYTRDEQLRRTANIIAVVAAFISVVSAAAAVAPFYLEHSRQAKQQEALMDGLISDNWLESKAALAHVVKDSPADVFVNAIDDWWYAADWAGDGPDPTPQAGSWERRDGAYQACLPRLLPGDQVCLRLADFVHDPASGLITRFSVDGLPVDAISWIKTDSQDLVPKDRGVPLNVRAISRIDLVSQKVRCVSYRLNMETEQVNGDGKVLMYFNVKRFLTQDINEKAASKRLLWPSQIHGFEKANAVVCVPDYGGWFQLVRQKSAKNDAATGTAWIGVS